MDLAVSTKKRLEIDTSGVFRIHNLYAWDAAVISCYHTGHKRAEFTLIVNYGVRPLDPGPSLMYLYRSYVCNGVLFVIVMVLRHCLRCIGTTRQKRYDPSRDPKLQGDNDPVDDDIDDGFYPDDFHSDDNISFRPPGDSFDYNQGPNYSHDSFYSRNFHPDDNISRPSIGGFGPAGSFIPRGDSFDDFAPYSPRRSEWSRDSNYSRHFQQNDLDLRMLSPRSKLAALISNKVTIHRDDEDDNVRMY
jgi:hypothetical protein